MEHPTIFDRGKPSISIRAIYTMAMLNNQMVFFSFCSIVNAQSQLLNGLSLMQFFIFFCQRLGVMSAMMNFRIVSKNPKNPRNDGHFGTHMKLFELGLDLSYGIHGCQLQLWSPPGFEMDALVEQPPIGDRKNTCDTVIKVVIPRPQDPTRSTGA